VKKNGDRNNQKQRKKEETKKTKRQRNIDVSAIEKNKFFH